MEQNLHSPEGYDFRCHDSIWQRVAPGLEPYPVSRQETASTAQPEGTMTSLQRREESQLPGAEVNPCCMGSAAAEMLEVLTGFIEEELQDRRELQALSRQAPSWARQRLRDLAAMEGQHAERLLAVYFLITGECYRPALHCGQVRPGSWCAALRERYHAAACSGLNYERAADGTTDPCLAKLLRELGTEEYRLADCLLRLLERSLRR